MHNGLFGLGELEDEKPICRYFKEKGTIAFSGNEVLISETVCQEQRKKEETTKLEPQPYPQPEPSPKVDEEPIEAETGPQVKTIDKIKFSFRVPKGKVANIMGVINLLQSKFETLEMNLTAQDGAISEQDYEDKIKEAFRQLGIELDEE